MEPLKSIKELNLKNFRSSCCARATHVKYFTLFQEFQKWKLQLLFEIIITVYTQCNKWQSYKLLFLIIIWSLKNDSQKFYVIGSRSSINQSQSINSRFSFHFHEYLVYYFFLPRLYSFPKVTRMCMNSFPQLLTLGHVMNSSFSQFSAIFQRTGNK